MIPFVRSLTELMVITQSRTTLTKSSDKKSEKNFLARRDNQINYNQNEKNKNKITLPSIPKSKIKKWIKSKEAVSRFFDNLDYNNQIQSSLDLTLLERQNIYDQQDVA